MIAFCRQNILFVASEMYFVDVDSPNPRVFTAEELESRDLQFGERVQSFNSLEEAESFVNKAKKMIYAVVTPYKTTLCTTETELESETEGIDCLFEQIPFEEAKQFSASVVETVFAEGSDVAPKNLSDLTNDHLKGWKEGDELGRGAFGRVVVAILRCKVTVCCKILDKSEPKKREVILKEVSVMKDISHENIVQFFGSSEDKGCIYIFMEYVTGGSLANIIQKSKAPLDTIKAWTRQILLGLRYLHNRSIVHRDIKGANILVTETGTLKLADFGCSKAHLSNSFSCKSFVGTFCYMAPEVLGKGYGTKADIWSAGCTVLEMHLQKAPFEKLNSLSTFNSYVLELERGAAVQLPADLDPVLRQFLLRTIVFDLGKRPSAAQLLEDVFLNS